MSATDDEIARLQGELLHAQQDRGQMEAALWARVETAEKQRDEYRENGQRLLEAADGWKLQAERMRECCKKYAAALSRIDYLCGEPNEFEAADFDERMDETAVIKNVERRLNEAPLLDALKRMLREHDAITISAGGKPGVKDRWPDAASAARAAIDAATGKKK